MTADRKTLQAAKPFTLYTEQKNGRSSATDYATERLAIVAAETSKKAGGYSHIFIRQYGIGQKRDGAKTVWEWKS